MEQGRSGRPVLVLVAPFPEGLESPAEPEKPIFNIRAYRVHKNLVRVSVFNIAPAQRLPSGSSAPTPSPEGQQAYYRVRL